MEVVANVQAIVFALGVKTTNVVKQLTEGDVVFVIPFFVIDYFWELINLEFLIFGRMGVIEDPLLKGNISADKIKKPADLFMLVLNK